MENLKIKFNGYNDIENSFSQASQDLFVLTCLNGKTNGTFLDLGCNHPTNINNTFLLESKFNWNGVSIDIESDYINEYHIRKTVALSLDATKIDFEVIMKNYNSNHIDYLSLDLEPAKVTLDALKNIPFDKIEFSVITYEHDSYSFGNGFRDESRQFLESLGYKRICSDVANDNYIYEDWYYNPKYVNYEDIKILESDSLNWGEIMFNNN